MKFLCPSCKAKYQISDEKLQGRIVKVKCRDCGHIMEIQQSGSSGPPPLRPAPNQASTLPEVPVKSTPRLSVAGHAATAEANGASAVAKSLAAAIVSPEEWYVGIGSGPIGPLGLDEIRDRAETGAIGEDSMVWRDGFEHWLPLAKFPELTSLVAKARKSVAESQAREAAEARANEIEKARQREEDQRKAALDRLTEAERLRQTESQAREAAEARANEIEKARQREEDERKATLDRLTEAERLRQTESQAREAAEARANEVEKARQREEDERKATLDRLTEAERLRQTEIQAREAAEARANEIEKARQREEVERKATLDRLTELERLRQTEITAREAAEARANEIEKARQREEEERKATHAQVDDLKRMLAEKREIREEVARIRETAQSLHTSLESTRRSPMLDTDTQHARRNLVSVSAIALALAIGRMSPSEINIMGIRFPQVMPSSILLGLVGVVSYLLLAFALKAYEAIRVWKKCLHDAHDRLLRLGGDPRLDDFEMQVPEEVAMVKAFLASTPEPVRQITPATFSDLIMPIVLAVGALVVCTVVR